MDKGVIAAQTYVKTENQRMYHARFTFEKAVTNVANTITRFSESIRKGVHQASETFNEKIINHKYRTFETRYLFIELLK